jgi:hypothetical protein
MDVVVKAMSVVVTCVLGKLEIDAEWHHRCDSDRLKKRHLLIKLLLQHKVASSCSLLKTLQERWVLVLDT